MAKHNSRAELTLSIRLAALTATGFLFIALQLPAATCHAERSLASVLRDMKSDSYQPVRDLMMRPVIELFKSQKHYALLEQSGCSSTTRLRRSTTSSFSRGPSQTPLRKGTLDTEIRPLTRQDDCDIAMQKEV